MNTRESYHNYMLRRMREEDAQPLPTENLSEILIILMEECAEVQQCASKILRFGIDEKNYTSLRKEVADLLEMIDRLHLGDLTTLKREKAIKLKTWSNL